MTANNTASIPTAAFTNNVDKISIPVKKVWIGPAAESVTVELLANGIKVDEVVLNESNGWQHTFEKLDRYNNGVEIEYTLREVAIDGYSAEITGNNAGYTITNTNIEKISIPVQKRWKGTEGSSVTVYLLADGDVVDTVLLDSDNDWKYVFDNLSKYDGTDGHEILYTVKEEPVPGYKTSITGNARNGFVITNTETPPDFPQTGDAAEMSLYIWMMILSSLGFIGILVSKKKFIRLKK